MENFVNPHDVPFCFKGWIVARETVSNEREKTWEKEDESPIRWSIIPGQIVYFAVLREDRHRHFAEAARRGWKAWFLA